MRRKALAALLLVGLGRLLSPAAVPVYDGIGAPDEPYRYVAAPAGVPATAQPTPARASSPVVSGLSAYGLSVTSGETGPQFSLFLPQRSVATGGTVLVADAVPLAPTDQPAGARINGNLYQVTLTGKGPVTLTAQAALASLYLRATSARQPAPVMVHRVTAQQPWGRLATKRAGKDAYVATFTGPGFYALAFADVAPHHASRLPYLLLGGLLLLVVLVVVVRLRAAE